MVRTFYGLHLIKYRPQPSKEHQVCRPPFQEKVYLWQLVVNTWSDVFVDSASVPITNEVSEDEVVDERKPVESDIDKINRR